MGVIKLIKNLSPSEKGTVLGFLVGAYLLFMSYFFNLFYTNRFCLGSIINLKMGGSSLDGICVRYASLLPLIVALFGLLVGFIIEEISKEEEKTINKKEKAIRIEQAKKWARVARKKGYGVNKIKEKFREAGWREKQIEKIFR